MASVQTAPYVTVGELGDELGGVQAWRITRLFQLKVVPDVPRAAGRRIIPRKMIPQIRAALAKRGWLPEREAATA